VPFPRLFGILRRHRVLRWYESNAATVLGILKYWRFFYASDILELTSTAFFLVYVQLMIHKALPHTVCYVINGLSCLFAVVCIAEFYFIIPAKQKYARKGVTATRKIYARATWRKYA